jgi:hypothetical protein
VEPRLSLVQPEVTMLGVAQVDKEVSHSHLVPSLIMCNAIALLPYKCPGRGD